MVAAELRTSTGLEVVGLRPLFEVRGYSLDVFHQSFAVTADGKGFMLARQQSSTASGAKPTIVLVRNWVTELEARLKR